MLRYSISDIYRKTAGMLLLFAGGFTRLDNYRALIAMAGLSPCEHTCSTSVRSKMRITMLSSNQAFLTKLILLALSLKARLFHIVRAKG